MVIVLPMNYNTFVREEVPCTLYAKSVFKFTAPFIDGHKQYGIKNSLVGYSSTVVLDITLPKLVSNLKSVQPSSRQFNKNVKSIYLRLFRSQAPRKGQGSPLPYFVLDIILLHEYLKRFNINIRIFERQDSTLLCKCLSQKEIEIGAQILMKTCFRFNMPMRYMMPI